MSPIRFSILGDPQIGGCSGGIEERDGVAHLAARHRKVDLFTHRELQGIRVAGEIGDGLLQEHGVERVHRQVVLLDVVPHLFLEPLRERVQLDE